MTTTTLTDLRGARGDGEQPAHLGLELEEVLFVTLEHFAVHVGVADGPLSTSLQTSDALWLPKGHAGAAATCAD